MTRRPAVRAIAKGIVLGALAVAIGGTTLAYAAGSDSPTPYTVDRTGITLPAGQTFPDNGHVNVRTTTGATYSVHFEGKCSTRADAECAGTRHDQAQYIGRSHLPWSALGIPVEACVAWVQIAQFSEHYGEGGQSPVCLTEEEPWPTPTPTTPTTTTAPPVEPSDPEPSGGTGPTPGDSPTSSPEPSPSASDAPTTSPSPAPSSEPSSTPTTPTSATPASTAPSTTYAAPVRPDLPAAAPATATPTTETTAPDHRVLAATGVNLTPYWVAIALAAIVVGAWLLHLIRPSKGDE